ncbi:hypothetical protein D3C80_2137480 [compost metagenome]
MESSAKTEQTKKNKKNKKNEQEKQEQDSMMNGSGYEKNNNESLPFSDDDITKKESADQDKKHQMIDNYLPLECLYYTISVLL